MLIAVAQDTEAEEEAEAEADTVDQMGIIILAPLTLTPTGEFCL